MNAFKAMNDTTVHDFTKQIITVALTKDPVDAVADIELALEVVKETVDEFLKNAGGSSKK